MNIGVSIIWMIVAVAIFSFSIYKYLRWRKDDKQAKEEFNRRIEKKQLP